LLAKAQCQSPNLSTEPPSSGASPLPHLFLRCLEDQARTLNCLRIAQTLHKPPVGAGLLAKALCQSLNLSTEPPSSGASPLPHLFLRCLEDQASTIACLRIAQTLHKPPVGAGLLAKALCQSPNLSTEPPSSGASPLPHLFLRGLEDQASTLNCLRIAQTLHKPPVGAGLPAKAQCQSPNLLTEPPSSGASPLPHLLCAA